jgi:hypothetical protein
MDSGLIGPDETAYRLELTAAQLKIVHTALHSLYDDLGREEHDVKTVVAAVLAKLPGEHEIRAIDLSRELRRTGLGGVSLETAAPLEVPPDEGPDPGLPPA